MQHRLHASATKGSSATNKKKPKEQSHTHCLINWQRTRESMCWPCTHLASEGIRTTQPQTAHKRADSAALDLQRRTERVCVCERQTHTQTHTHTHAQTHRYRGIVLHNSKWAKTAVQEQRCRCVCVCGGGLGSDECAVSLTSVVDAFSKAQAYGANVTIATENKKKSATTHQQEPVCSTRACVRVRARVYPSEYLTICMRAHVCVMLLLEPTRQDRR